MSPSEITSVRRSFEWLRISVSKSALSLCFVLLVFPLGLVLAFITPPGLVGDEPAHMVREEALLHGGIVGERQTSVTSDGRTVVNSGFYIDPAIVGASFEVQKPLNPALWAEKIATRWTHQRVFAEINPISAYFPLFYIPSAIGLGTARLLGASPFQAIYAGRLASYCCYFLIGLMALVLARRGQAMIFLALSMPMGLSIGASCSPDGLIIATAALGAALFSRGARRPAAACIAAVIIVKPPYGLLAALFLLPLSPVRAWITERRVIFQRVGYVMLTLLPAILWFLYSMSVVTVNVPRAPYHPGPLWPGNPNIIFFSTDSSAQLRVVFAHPVAFATLFWNNIVTPFYFEYWVKATIGILNWLSLLLPPSIYNLWMAGATGALVADMLTEDDRGPALPDTFVLMAAIFGSIFLVWLSEYLTWTNVGLEEIDGAQGRYFLPLFPILGLALPLIKFRGAWMLRRAALSLPILASLGTLILLPRWLAVHFYLN